MKLPAAEIGISRVRGGFNRGLRLLALSAAFAFAVAPASAFADGDVEVTVVDDSGTGTVTSTSVHEFAEFGGVVVPTPAEINCNDSGGPVCNANFNAGGLNAFVTLAATPDPGSVFLGWTQAGGSSSARCTTPPSGDPTCEVTLSGAPGPTSTVTATFGPAPDPPTVSTGNASAIGDTGATLNGAVNPQGSPVEECHFEYGTTTEYGAVAACIPDPAGLGEGNAAQSVEAATPPLEPGTTYHFRLVASNPGGASHGENRTFTTTGAPTCSNFERRLEQGIHSILLPDCMALEMVSPAQKGGQPARKPQVSADGGRVKFDTVAALAGTPGILSNSGDPYVATREQSGWQTAHTNPPGEFVTGWAVSARASSFTPDFSRWLQVASTEQQRQLHDARAFRGGLGMPFLPLSPLLEHVGATAGTTVPGTELQGASGDHSRLFFRPGFGSGNSKLLSYSIFDPAPAPAGSADKNVYVAELDSDGNPSLALLARQTTGGNAGKAWGGNCGTRVGGASQIPPGANLTTPNGQRNQGAISADGKRVYFSTRPDQPATGNCDHVNKMRIMQRIEGEQGVWIGELFPSPAGVGDDFYQGASADGTKVYFTTNRQLAATDLDSGAECSRLAAPVGCDLYLYDATEPPGERLIQVSAGEDSAEHTAGEGARVYGAITGVSGDGSHVYYVAQGVLTTDSNPAGEVAEEGQPNLYLYQRDAEYPDGRTAFVGTLVAGDAASSVLDHGLWGGDGTWRNRAYPVPVTGTDADGNQTGGSGHVLVFQSKAPLTVDDTDGGFLDVFRYNAGAEPPTLERISKPMPGGADDGPFDVSTKTVDIRAKVGGVSGTDFAEEGRWVSEDGETIAFKTAERLLPGGAEGVTEAHLWSDGRLVRLPGTADPAGTLDDRGPVLSRDGSTVAFTSFQRLLPFDGDSTVDVYVARSRGGHPFPQPPVPCVPDGAGGCQSAPAAPAALGAASTGVTAGNVPASRRCAATAQRARNLAQRAQRLRRAASRVANPRRTRQLRRRAQRLTKRAQTLSRNAKRCRQNAGRRAAR